MSATRPYTKSARAATEGATRSALLDAAETAFFDGPWESVSLESMARAAGTTKQTLLRHFGSKTGLLTEAHRRSFERVRDQRFGGPSGDVEGAVDNLLDHYAEHGSRALRIGADAELGRVARQLHYDWVDHAFGPWLTGRRRERLRAALIVACDVQAWSILANDLELPRAEVRATLVMTIRSLLEESR